jgi:preprotein translocase SecE subunit
MLGIHKPEQGYWVRVLSAVFFGVLVLAGAAWAYNQAEAAELPPKAFILELASIDGSFDAGGSVDLIRTADDATGSEIVIATAGVIETTLSGTAGRIEISVPESTAAGYLVEDVERLRAGSGAEAGTARVTAKRRVPIFPVIYLQAGVTGAVMLLGAIAVYFFAATNRGSVDFLINTDGEMRKVNWSTRKEIIGSTQVVIVAAFLIAAILFGIDTAFAKFFEIIGVIET